MTKMSKELMESIVASELAQVQSRQLGISQYKMIYNMIRLEGLGSNPKSDYVEPTIQRAHFDAIEAARQENPQFDVDPPTRTIGPWKLVQLYDSIDFGVEETFDEILTIEAECLHNRLRELFTCHYARTNMIKITPINGIFRQPRGWLEESSDWVYESGECRTFEVVSGRYMIDPMLKFSISRVGEREPGKTKYEWLFQSTDEDLLLLVINCFNPSR